MTTNLSLGRVMMMIMRVVLKPLPEEVIDELAALLSCSITAAATARFTGGNVQMVL